MDSIVGFTGKDYTIIMADAGIARSIVRMKEDEDKIMTLDQSKMMGTSGPVGDRVQFGEYIQKNIALYAIRNKYAVLNSRVAFLILRCSYPLTTHGAAHFVRNELATALREGPYQVNLLIGGVDQSLPSLYYIDYLGSMHKMNYAVHGYASYFLLSVLDRLYTKDMTLEQVISSGPLFTTVVRHSYRSIGSRTS
jgi:20S proteasome subunit beta 4